MSNNTVYLVNYPFTRFPNKYNLEESLYQEYLEIFKIYLKINLKKPNIVVRINIFLKRYIILILMKKIIQIYIKYN